MSTDRIPASKGKVKVANCSKCTPWNTSNTPAKILKLIPNFMLYPSSYTKLKSPHPHLQYFPRPLFLTVVLSPLVLSPCCYSHLQPAFPFFLIFFLSSGTLHNLDPITCNSSFPPSHSFTLSLILQSWVSYHILFLSLSLINPKRHDASYDDNSYFKIF